LVLQIELIVGIYLLFELSEAYFQKGNTLKELLLYNAHFYRNSPLFYTILHSSYFFMLFLYLYYGYLLLLVALIVKSFDLGYKLFIVGRIESEGDIYLENILKGQDIEINWILKYISSGIYVFIVYMALTQSV